MPVCDVTDRRSATEEAAAKEQPEIAGVESVFEQILIPQK